MDGERVWYSLLLVDLDNLFVLPPMLSNAGQADPNELPLLITAARENGPWLVTFNLRHYQPGHPDITATSPGEFVLRVRELLTRRHATE